MQKIANSLGLDEFTLRELIVGAVAMLVVVWAVYQSGIALGLI